MQLVLTKFISVFFYPYEKYLMKDDLRYRGKEIKEGFSVIKCSYF